MIILIFFFISADELNNLLADNGLTKILRNVRSDLQKSKREFLNSITSHFDPFISSEAIDNRILTKLWKELEEMKCNYLCPWCGMPCCGTTNCNDSYEKFELPTTFDAPVKHSCQFHRDASITGIKVRKSPDQLANYGGCPLRITNKITRRIPNPADKNGETIWVPYTYYDTTWRIKSSEEDPDQESGFFWQWFLSFVSISLVYLYFTDYFITYY